jgi:hypothetical protein
MLQPVELTPPPSPYMIYLPVAVREYKPGHVSPFGVAMYQGVENANGLAKMAVANSRWFTTYLNWSAVEPAALVGEVHTYDCADFDATVGQAQAAGMGVFVLFSSNPAWAAALPGGPATNTQNFNTVVAAAAEGYDGDGNGDAPGNMVVNFLSFYAEPDSSSLELAEDTGRGYWGNSAAANANMLALDGFLAFQFRPLAMLTGVPVYFELEAPQATPGNAVTALGVREDKHPAGQAVFTGLPLAGAVRYLAFRLYYRPGARRAKATMLDRRANGRPAIFGAPQLYLVLLLVYLIGLAGLGALVIAQMGQDGP